MDFQSVRSGNDDCRMSKEGRMTRPQDDRPVGESSFTPPKTDARTIRIAIMPEENPTSENAAADTSQSSSDPQPEREAAEAGLREQLEAARAERDENRDKWLRAEAELDNYRKRAQKETEELRRFQALSLARDLLPALDNLDRAVAAAESTGNVDDLLQGIRMVARQFREVLARHSVEPIAAAGRPFDPNLHEALQQVPTAEHPPLTVVQEVEPGYKLHERVVRPSKVIVAAAPVDEDKDEDRG